MSSKEDDHKLEGEYEPATPTCKDDFTQIWASAILQDCLFHQVSALLRGKWLETIRLCHNSLYF